MEAIFLKRYGLVLVAVVVSMLAGVALAQVGHITPVGHVETVQLDWRVIQSGDVVLNDGVSFTSLSQDDAPAGTNQLGVLQLPEDKTYNLSLLGGIEATNSLNPALSSVQAGPIEAQLSAGPISGDWNVQGQNMVLLYNNETGKWDGYDDYSFKVENNSSYDMASDWYEVKIRVIAAKATEVSSGGGGGGCSVGFLAPAAFFLLAPLFLLRRRG